MVYNSSNNSNLQEPSQLSPKHHGKLARTRNQLILSPHKRNRRAFLSSPVSFNNSSSKANPVNHSHLKTPTL